MDCGAGEPVDLRGSACSAGRPRFLDIMDWSAEHFGRYEALIVRR